MASNRSFAHLHVHTDHSCLDGQSLCGELAAAAARDGQTAIAITDHGTLSGVIDMHKACKAHGITALPGIEAYLAFGSLHERNSLDVEDDSDPDDNGSGRSKTKRYEHLTLLAASRQGWSNLSQMSTTSYRDGKWGKHPRIDMDLLADHADGIIALTGCLGGPLAGRLSRGDDAGAEAWLARAVEILGPDNVVVEVMDHGIDRQKIVIPKLVGLARKFGLRVAATNDSHYTEHDEHVAHDAWLCVQTGRQLQDHGRFKFQGDSHYLRTAGEMRALFSEQPGTEQACDTTLWIAERIADAGEILPLSPPTLPRFEVPDGWDTDAKYLKHLAAEGAKVRYGDPIPDHVKRRLRYEFDVIEPKGFVPYFLIVADMISWARSQGIRVGAGRGSAAGSVLSYCLGIVSVDPLEHDLLFERFLHPERMSMPDIDTDFDQRRRPEVLAYLRQRWGDDRVAHIGTFGKVKAKNAIRDAIRVLGAGIREPKLANDLSNAFPPPKAGRPVPIADALDPTNEAGTELRRLASIDDSAANEALALARSFEGRIRSEGVHPCGVVIGADKLETYMPLRFTEDGAAVTQFEADDVEACGLVKMDVLGLRNLTIIERCVGYISRRHEPVDVDALPTGLDDPTAAKTWAMIQAGDTSGVFQLESSGMQDLCRRLAPTTFGDLAALIALYRPGPMASGLHHLYADRKNGRVPVDYDALTGDPIERAALEQVLGSTFGALTYQEQAMRLSQVLAGFSAGKADDLRKAVGKKLPEKMAALRNDFVDGTATESRMEDGSVKPAYSRQLGERVWAQIEAGADYLFNKSHAVAYADTTWITAWLKANFPVEYNAALLAENTDPTKRFAVFADAHRAGIKIIGPSINGSEILAAPDPDHPDAIRLGLAEVAGMKKIADRIVGERLANGRFESISDLCGRVARVPSSDDGGVEVPGIDKGNLDALVKAGAFDEFGRRLGLFQTMVFHSLKAPSLPVIDAEWDPVERLLHERSVLGVFVSGHPVALMAQQLREWSWSDVGVEAVELRPLSRIHQLANHTPFSTFGVITGLTVKISKRGEQWARFRLEGTRSSVEVMVWAKQLRRLREMGVELRDGMVVAVAGSVLVDEAYDPSMDADDDVSDQVVEQVRRLVLERVEEIIPADASSGTPTPPVFGSREVIFADRQPDEPEPDAEPGAEPVAMVDAPEDAVTAPEPQTETVHEQSVPEPEPEREPETEVGAAPAPATGRVIRCNMSRLTDALAESIGTSYADLEHLASIPSSRRLRTFEGVTAAGDRVIVDLCWGPQIHDHAIA